MIHESKALEMVSNKGLSIGDLAWFRWQDHREAEPQLVQLTGFDVEEMNNHSGKCFRIKRIDDKLEWSVFIWELKPLSPLDRMVIDD